MCNISVRKAATGARFLVITSDENTCWAIGLVEEAAVDGQQGSTHDATIGWGDSRHLWTRDKHFTVIRINSTQEVFQLLRTNVFPSNEPAKV